MGHFNVHYHEILHFSNWYWVLAASYLLGSIPWGLLISKVFLGIDPRTLGSGNIGMTNVMRTGGKWPGLATFVLDFGKGTLAVWVTLNVLDAPGILGLMVGFVVVFGHTRSVFLKFKGGKGVATNFGVWLALDWRVCVGILAIWAGLFFWKRISSLSALGSLTLLPAVTFIFIGFEDKLYLATILSLYLILLHRTNIVRLVTGQESKLKSKSEGSHADE